MTSRRWIIAALLFLAAVLNYVDKNTLALLAPTIQADLGLSDQDYAGIQNAFQIAYTIALLGSGVVVDLLGSRLSQALFVGWWSLANVLTSLARGMGSLAGFRFLLGLGEAGNWTASPKAVSEWFPVKERGLAIGIYTAGTPVGMTLAPLFIIWLSESWGWQSSFVATGVLGLLWLVPWLLVSRSPSTRSGPGGREPFSRSADAREAAHERAGGGRSWVRALLEALAQPVVWCLLLGRMLSDPVWFFYQSWFPKYLVTERGLTQADLQITWVMFLAAGLGSIVGGWVAGSFIRRGAAPARVRALVMLVCALFMPLSPLVARAPSAWGSLLFASIIVFAHLAWLTNISALVVDVVPKRSLGSVFGMVAAGSSVGAILMNNQVASLLKPDPLTKLVQPHAYTGWFLIAAWLHLLAVPLILWGVRRCRAGGQVQP